MLDKIIEKLVGVRPLELLPILAVVLGQDNEDGEHEVFDVWDIYVAASDALQYGTIDFKLGSEEARANGTDADPAASSAYVEHAAEDFGIEVVGADVRKCVMDVSAGAEKRNEVYGRPEGGREGEF
jgi:hypothetical protein